MADIITNRGKYLIATVGLGNLDLRMALVTGTQTGVDNPDLNTLAALDAVAGVGIHTERVALTSETVTENDGADRVDAAAATVTFAAAPGVTAQAAVIFHEASASDAGRELVAVYTTGFPQPVDGGLVVPAADYLRLA
jgi:hypothetical protein